MVPGGTYLLTIEVIPTELDTTKVEEFITTINGTGTEVLDFQGALGATTNQVVLRTINPIPPGKHSFTVGLKPFSFDLPGPFTTLDREVELWILPPARRFALCECMSSCVNFSHVRTVYSDGKHVHPLCRTLQHYAVLKWWAVLWCYDCWGWNVLLQLHPWVDWPHLQWRHWFLCLPALYARRYLHWHGGWLYLHV